MTKPIHRRTFLKTASIGAAACSINRPLFAGESKIIKQTFTYKTVGTLAIQADVYRPDDQIARPVAIWIHGGALIMGSRAGVSRRVKDAMLGDGYTLVSIDYRLAPQTKLPGIISDVEDAIRWVHEQGPELFHADTKRIAVLGGSAGGYLTLTSGFRAKPRPAVLVAFWGYGDLVGDWYSKPSGFYRKRPLVAQEDALDWIDDREVTDGNVNRDQRRAFYLYCRQNGLWPKYVTGVDPVSGAAKIASYEPLRNVTKDYPPTLMIHGTIDTDVPYEQSTLMDKELARHKVEHTLITVPDAGHGLAKGDPKLIDQAYAEVLPFVNRYVKGS
jgi:acetyl esterase/lipase